MRSTSDAEEIQEKASALLGEHLCVSRAFYFSIERKEEDYIYITRKDYYSHCKMKSLVGRYPQSEFGQRVLENLPKGETLIVRDVKKLSTVTPEELEHYLAMDIHSFVAVPLVKAGEYVAGFVVEDPVPRNWTEEEIYLIEETSERTWAAVERAIAEEAQRINEERMRELKDAYKSVLNGMPLKDSLNILTKIVSNETSGEARMTFYIVNEAGTHLNPIRGAGNMPENYLETVDNFPIGPDSIACGLAVPTGKPILTADVFEDPDWRPFTSIAERFDYRGCWSFPIKTRDNDAVGTFTWYFRTRREATQKELALAEIIMQAAAVIIFYHTNNEKRILVENELKITANALRESEQQLKEFNESLEELAAQRTYELRQSKELLQSVLNSTVNSITVFEAIRNEEGFIIDFRYVLCNEQAKLYEGSDPAQKLYSEVYQNTMAEDMFAKFISVVETGESSDFELHYKDEKNEQNLGTWYRVKLVKLGDGLVVSGEDITPRKKAEVELLKLKLSQQKEILNTVLNTQEDERKRISESLHNGLGQLLYAVKIRSEYLQPDPTLEEQKTLKSEVDQLLEEAIDQTRYISHQLSSLLLETFGLKGAIDEIVKHLKSDTFLLTFKFISERQRFDPTLEIAVFRIVQELANNIIKHSKASVANIRIESNDTTFTIIVKDSGIGFQQSAMREKKKSGIGLQMVENRVKLLNGTMNIESDKETGTRIKIDLNL